MITEDKVTELFCMADDSCKFFDAMMEKYTLKSDKKQRYHRDSTMSKAEIMLIMILFHTSGYRCLKHFYLEKVCKHLRHLFPKVVSYNLFVDGIQLITKLKNNMKGALTFLLSTYLGQFIELTLFTDKKEEQNTVTVSVPPFPLQSFYTNLYII